VRGRGSALEGGEGLEEERRRYVFVRDWTGEVAPPPKIKSVYLKLQILMGNVWRI
jgi:hypothetical protein